ncbi:hypothetical protein KEJ34_08615 [Candidatus Bathyarchaeota archaeon]|nr:hypothetical protein [Candidatus Bathyarchaeota archaeon]
MEFSLERFRDIPERAIKLYNVLLKDEAPKPDPEPWECHYCEFNDQVCRKTGHVILLAVRRSKRPKHN